MVMDAVERRMLARLLGPMSIVHTSLPLRWRPTTAKVVIFDVYGTLLSSAAGDVGSEVAGDDGETFVCALNDAGIIGTPLNSRLCSGLIEQTVQEARRARMAQGVDHPEVDILEVWRCVLDRLGMDGVDQSTLRLAALAYECRVNPVWPMPGLSMTLDALAGAGVEMGILSNAQFYTPLLLEYFLGGSLQHIGLCSDLLRWSYLEGVGKPSMEFFVGMQQQVTQRGGAPHHVLYVGNDMRKDILPARQVGWQTVLYAGDTRSLRLLPDCSARAGQEPDMVIHRLDQLIDILT